MAAGQALRNLAIAAPPALALNAAIVAWARPQAPDFILLSYGVVLFWTLVGAAGIVLVHGLLARRGSGAVARLWKWVALALGLTVLPDLAMLLIGQVFPGQTVGAVWVLILLHATCAGAVMATSPLWRPKP
ncbi:MAG: hypothetical protein Q7T61_12515 [Caulobacter sp.]|nr:hypothetical protein [Caulobacter sp.]